MYLVLQKFLVVSALLVLHACTAPAARNANPASPAPSSSADSVLAGIAFGRALGFEIGDLMHQAEDVAASRGASLACTPPNPAEPADASFCQPERSPVALDSIPLDSLAAHVRRTESMFPPYALHMDGDTVDAIYLRLDDRGLSRAAVEAHWDALAPRSSEGSKTGSSLRTEAVVWAVPGKRDWARMECLIRGGTEMCSLFIGRMATPADLERALVNWRAHTPEPLRRP